jgi:nucleotide-binding universal stress UspA family protein
MIARSQPRVVVGVDGSLHGLAALRAATAEAARRGVPLYAVRVRSAASVPFALGEIDEAFVEALGGLPRNVELHREVALPPVAGALVLRAGQPGDLLVLGEGGRGLWHAFWSGSVTRACLRKARCPVLTVPAPEMARTVWRPRRWSAARRDIWQRFDEESPALRG